jgi:hypothetical protein
MATRTRLVTPKSVAKRLQAEAFPILEAAGFGRFTARKAWRYARDCIHVIDFASLSAYQSQVANRPTQSFHSYLGCYPRWLPQWVPDYPIKEKNGQLLPEEWHCPFRRVLVKNIGVQAGDCPDQGKYLWYVDDQGQNLDLVMAGVCLLLREEVLDWFDRLSDPLEMRRVAEMEPERPGVCWGYGRHPSPLNSLVLGYAALRLDDHDAAREQLTKAAAKFPHLAARIREDLGDG